MKETIRTISKPKYSYSVVWIFSSVGIFVVFSLFLLTVSTTLKPRVGDKYSIYSSKPLTLETSQLNIHSKDARAQKINEVFRQYNCPMEGLGEKFVSEADKNNIPWWLVASIAFQESSCGKQMPNIEGATTYNSWGWGVYGENVHAFDNWARGIETVSRYMSERFFSQGITEPCEIMATYTPPSQGSWCEGVNFFGDQIKGYTTSQD
ncbi:hypothetical protein OAL67_00665 [bacterium]|nr:hypothetical protein [bacterium]